MTLTCMYQDENQRIITTSQLNKVPKNSGFVWYDCIQPTKEEKEYLQNDLNLDQNEVASSIYTLGHPDIYHNAEEDIKHIVVHTLDTKDFSARPLNITITENSLVTIHESKIALIDYLQESLEKGSIKPDAEIITLKLLHKIIESYFTYVGEIEEEVFNLEYQNVDSDRNKKMMREVYDIRAEIIKLKRVILPMEQLAETIQTSNHFNENQHKKRLVHRILNQLKHQTATLRACEELTDEIKDNNESYHSSRINSVINVLTILSSIFFPLTLLTGWFGMNFTNMPELHWKYSYFVFIGITVVLSIALIVLFKKKRWF